MVRAKRAGASIELAFGSAKVADAVHRSLKPEELLPESAGCKVSIRRTKNVLCLEIDAKDTTALRAALNSFLRWATVARDMTETGRE